MAIKHKQHRTAYLVCDTQHCGATTPPEMDATIAINAALNQGWETKIISGHGRVAFCPKCKKERGNNV